MNASVMDELRNQLKTMNRQFGFYTKYKTAIKNNLIGILDQQRLPGCPPGYRSWEEI